ncbi:hypothetical protein P3L10_029695 [Capsicum annuum]
MIEMHRAWANGLPPPPFPTDNLEYLSSLPPVSHAQFPISVDTPQHASGPTPGKQYPKTSNIYFLTSQYKITTCSSLPAIHAFAAPLSSEAPTFNVNPTIVIPHSTSDPILKIFSNQHYAPEPTFKSTGPYDFPQLFEFSPNTEKPVMIEEQEEMAKKFRNLCMFPGVHLPLGFKMPKFEKYDGHGDPIAYLRCYCNQLRGAGEKEELLMAYFGESLLGLASELFVEQDIDKWNSWDDLANEFVEQFQYNMELIPDQKSLTNMKKKSTETFREYAIRWHEQAARVKPPMKESKIVETFIQAQDETYYQHLLPTLGKPFIEVLKMGETIVTHELKPKFMPKLHRTFTKIYYIPFPHLHIKCIMCNLMFNLYLTHTGVRQLCRVIFQLHIHTEALLGLVFNLSQTMK